MIDGLKPYPTYRKSPAPWMAATPEHWRIERGKALFSESLLPVQDRDEIVTCFRDGQVTLRTNRRTRGFMLALHELGYQGVRRGQLVIHAMDAFAGAIGISDSDGKCTPEYIVCDPRSEGVTPAYFSLVLRLAAHQGFILASCPAVRERAPRFRYPHFGAMLLPVPPPAEQAAIVRFLDHAHRRIERCIRGKRQLIALLNEQRQAIIHRAVTHGLDPNVPMKDSGVPWLGEIPAHWDAVRFKSGVGFREGPGIMAADFRRDGVPLLRISCLSARIANLAGCNYLDPQKVSEKWGHFRVQPGDYLLSASGSTGAVRQAGTETVGAVPYTGIIRLWPRSSAVNMEFLRVFMSSELFAAQIRVAKSGVGIEHFGPTHLKRMWISLPPQNEQKSIVARLEEQLLPLDSAQERSEREIALMREYRTRLVADVVTGQLDVREAARSLPDVESDDAPAVDSADVADLLENDAEVTDGEAA